jgi:hypothetical protein
MAILGIVVAGMLSFFATLQKTTVRQTSRGQALDDIRLVMERVTKEARQMTGLRAGSSASVLDMDTYANGVAERITYTASGTTLTRSVNGATALTVLSGITSTTVFAYTPSVSAPTDITITLVAHPTHYATDSATVSLTSEVELRNLR